MTDPANPGTEALCPYRSPIWGIPPSEVLCTFRADRGPLPITAAVRHTEFENG